MNGMTVSARDVRPYFRRHDILSEIWPKIALPLRHAVIHRMSIVPVGIKNVLIHGVALLRIRLPRVPFR